MKRKRSALACAVYQQEFYAIGGKKEASVEIYNIESGTWRDGPELPSIMIRGQAVVHGGMLFIIYGDGNVFQLEGNGKDWKKVTKIASYTSRPVFPALVVKKAILKC